MFDTLNNKNTIIIIGRAHSGTRILPSAMIESEIFMGSPLNEACDLLPEHTVYKACRIFGKYVQQKDTYHWDFTNACTMDIPTDFKDILSEYLQSLIQSDAEKKGWKIPNNTLIYPWLVRLLPKASFIFWVRHPEGSCSKMTGVDRLEKWNIPCKKFLFHEWNYKMRAISWKYHYDIVKQTPQPAHFMQIRFEDYVLNQEKTKQTLEQFIGKPLNPIILNKQKAGNNKSRYRKKYPFLKEAMEALDYQ